jgi:hypothetical protein
MVEEAHGCLRTLAPQRSEAVSAAPVPPSLKPKPAQRRVRPDDSCLAIGRVTQLVALTARARRAARRLGSSPAAGSVARLMA